MVVDRIERHDIANALLLAGILLLFGFGIVRGAGTLFSTLDDGLVDKEKVLEADVSPSDGTDTSQLEAKTTTTTLVAARPIDEVLVRVANGARRAGVAGAGTEAAKAAGYPTLSAKNGPTRDDSVVYYIEGYAADAIGVAEALGLEPDEIEAMPTDPGVSRNDAHIIVILGINSDY